MPTMKRTPTQKKSSIRVPESPAKVSVVKIVGGKIETNPKLMNQNVKYPVVYKGKKYYVKKVNRNIFVLGTSIK